MRRILSSVAVLTIIALGLYSGNSLARAVGHAGIVDSFASKETVDVEIPAFVVTIKSVGTPMEHVHAIMRLKVNPEAMTDSTIDDKLADALLEATSKAFSENGSANDDKGAAVAKKIASYANVRLGGPVIAELQIKKLAMFKSQRRQ